MLIIHEVMGRNLRMAHGRHRGEVPGWLGRSSGTRGSVWTAAGGTSTGSYVPEMGFDIAAEADACAR